MHATHTHICKEGKEAPYTSISFKPEAGGFHDFKAMPAWIILGTSECQPQCPLQGSEDVQQAWHLDLRAK